MEKEGLFWSRLREIPNSSVMLLSGPPGAGKSTFCNETAVKRIIEGKPVILVTTDQSPVKIIDLLKKSGIGEYLPQNLCFVDAYSETVGLACTPREDTVCANCSDLNSLSIATTRLQKKMAQKDILLIFDSLTSPYIFCGFEIIRFIRLFLSKFAAEGNSVLVCFDQGCGKKEDLTSIMSLSDVILNMEIKESTRIIDVVKHPTLRPEKIEAKIGSIEPERIGIDYLFDNNLWDLNALKKFIQSFLRGEKAALRRDVGDYVNLIWPNLAQWSGMLWDPKRFPLLKYQLNKEDASSIKKMLKSFPWQIRMLLKFAPNKISNKKEMDRMLRVFAPMCKQERSGIVEYLGDISKADEHYVRVYESSDCSVFEDVGIPMAAYLPSNTAGMCEGFEEKNREWNAVETKCIGLGDPYCEFKLVPGQRNELKSYLESIDNQIIERIHDRLINRLMGFMINGKPLVNRPILGSNIHLHTVGHSFSFPYMAGERYQMALRMGGTKAGMEVGKHLMNAGLSEDEALKKIYHFLKHCKIGKLTIGETIKVKDNCESIYMKLLKIKTEESQCFFTTGFLNGFFITVKNKHVKEIKCAATGDPYCEWEIR